MAALLPHRAGDPYHGHPSFVCYGAYDFDLELGDYSQHQHGCAPASLRWGPVPRTSIFRMLCLCSICLPA
ncbi:uncharacterized protein L969DRAFT_52039 [Mixia osmundae IAM 14324]|uniref:Uncharacterized protein n=1 Tax=Mixia osmundae (strain CBS 9802 / IAM 14324 / JCM 22182 / KY 12970) TaxID=764103 RepID=G7DWX0_MIXOS|nr:uncharacterized protein L969DRAFT_55555 [Mixia osmundae IAM 14324]XP_014566690.1 uncharacterized protein L969DRAFT_52039 [Mixia osmundae IAM 14324]KEI36156.1 hypothetical protein L969DRAFT_55555 [Mixia osmundae IAM 14324]KEI38124.1 hypothetical protein L969DRAFT_52039 [Mixia osmundae IAM 14324]GAA95067.1 hypothetical protein E5Q_01722 [Mixia osmundae IAM 14324]